MSTTLGPTLAGFNTFVRDVMKIDPTFLPVDDPLIGYAYASSQAIVNPSLGGVIPGQWTMPPPVAQWSPFALATYNLAGSNIIHFAQDQPGRTYFRDLRTQYRIDSFTPGIVSSTSDGGTSTSLLNPDFMKGLTLANLQQLKDPWGRQYLMFAQSYGPTIWGIS